MDKKDERIIFELLKNARISFTELAKKLGITETAVRKRVKKLEEEGVILGYTALIEPSRAGFGAVAVVGVDTKPDALLGVFDKIRRQVGVRYAALSSGDHMIVFEIWCRNQNELSRAIGKIERMDGVVRVCPALLLRRIA
ncbi:MAG: Lrp/AsnC family transcriptional regulator [Candidatus Micrarchaeia archaeon]